jgi:hypothetical protein
MNIGEANMNCATIPLNPTHYNKSARWIPACAGKTRLPCLYRHAPQAGIQNPYRKFSFQI